MYLVTCPEELRQAFVMQLTGLLEASLPVTVVLAMRDDFYGRLAQAAPELLGWLERGLVNVPPTLVRDELQAIVEEPARAVGLAFEVGLVDAILEDAMESAPEGEGRAGRSTVLPLLEFALTELWERRRDGVLTHEAYGTIGGVTGGLAQWADRAFYGLEEEQQRLARRILTDLVHLGDESQGLPDSRWRRPLAALCRDEGEREAVHGVTRRLADARLLVTRRDLRSGQETVELIHDALLREWGLLQGWLRDDHRFLAWRQALEGRVQAWVESSPHDPAQRDEGRLLRSRDLVEAERWLAERGDDLRGDERAFIKASAARAKRVRRLTVSRVALVFLVMSLLPLLFLWQWNQAVYQSSVAATAQADAIEQRDEAEAARATAEAAADIRATAQAQAETAQAEAESRRQEAEEQRQIALSRQLAARAQIVLDNTGTGLVRSALLAVESLRRFPSFEGDQALRRGLSLLPHRGARVAHEGRMQAIIFSPDGRRVASGGRDGMVRVWMTITGQEVAQMAHKEAVWALAFSPDGQRVVSAGERTARVWDVETGEEVAWVEHRGMEHEGVVLLNALALSPDGRWVALGSRDGVLQVWEIVTGQEVTRIEQEDRVSAVTFSLDGQWLVSVSSKLDGDSDEVRVWETATGQEVARIEQEDRVSAVTFSPDGRWVACGDMEGVVRVWEAATGQEIAQMQMQPRESVRGSVAAVAFSPDGRWVAAGEGNTVWVWEAVTGQEVARMKHELIVTTVAFSPKGRWIASGSWDGTARMWEASTGQEVARMVSEGEMHVVKWEVHNVVFSPDGRWLATRTTDGTVRVWETVAGQEVARMEHEDGVEAVAFSPDGRLVASGSRDNTARVWEAATGQEVARMAHEGGVTAVAFSPPDGRLVASGGDDGTTRVWEAATGQEVARMTHEGGVTAVAFSPLDGRLVASGGDDGTTRVWMVVTGQEVARIEHKYGVHAVAFSPDGQWVAAGSHEGWDGPGEVGVWEAATGQEVALTEHEAKLRAGDFINGRWATSGSRDGIAQVWEAITSKGIALEHKIGWEFVTFSPYGRWVVSWGGNTVQVWEADTGKEVARTEHENWVSVLTLSPDGQWGASGEGYQMYGDRPATIKVWKTATGQEVTQMTDGGYVTAVAFSPDGQFIASGSYDGTVRIWLWKPEDLIEEACSRLPRNLTREEWQMYLGDEPYRPTCPNLPVPEG